MPQPRTTPKLHFQEITCKCHNYRWHYCEMKTWQWSTHPSLLDKRGHYNPRQPMVKDTQQRVNQIITQLHQGNRHIDDMTAKWLSQTSSPPRIHIFYTLTKIHKPKPGVKAQQREYHHLWIDCSKAKILH